MGILNELLKEVLHAELKRKTENRKEWKTWKPRTQGRPVAYVHCVMHKCIMTKLGGNEKHIKHVKNT